MAGKEENREQIPGEILEKCWPKEDEKCPCFHSFKAIRGLYNTIAICLFGRRLERGIVNFQRG